MSAAHEANSLTLVSEATHVDMLNCISYAIYVKLSKFVFVYTGKHLTAIFCLPPGIAFGSVVVLYTTALPLPGHIPIVCDDVLTYNNINVARKRFYYNR